MRKTLRQYIPLALMVTLFSEVHFYPLSGALRLSLGIVLIHLIGLIRSDIHLPRLTVLSGLLIGIERFVSQLLLHNGPLADALHFVQPSIIYYGCFAAIHLVVRLHRYEDRLFTCVLLMAGIDALSNALEALFRSGFSLQLLQIVLLAGLIRALTAYALYLLWKRQRLFIQRQEHQKRYIELTSLAADVETELFYLRKSTDQIESVMQQSYRLYDELSETSASKPGALEIAREIHEIKKDYLRVLSGFEDFMGRLENMEELRLSEIFNIIEASAVKVIQETGNNIHLDIKLQQDLPIRNYLSIFTILNNLIDNSIAALDGDGYIRVQAQRTADKLCLRVEDNGQGIAPALQEVVFNPGFTTKFDPRTGKASTGIGLSHVQNLVTQLEGHIHLTSTQDQGTAFDVTLPISHLEGTA